MPMAAATSPVCAGEEERDGGLLVWREGQVGVRAWRGRGWGRGVGECIVEFGTFGDILGHGVHELPRFPAMMLILSARGRLMSGFLGQS